jgi:hypothetical protein
MGALRRAGIRGERLERSKRQERRTAVLKPVAPRLAETSWPARSRFARGAGVVDGAEKTPESDEGSTPVGAAVKTLASPGEGALSEIGPDYSIAQGAYRNYCY